MRTFVIIMLAIGIVNGLSSFVKKVEEKDGVGILASMAHIAAYIVAVVFACKI